MRGSRPGRQCGEPVTPKVKRTLADAAADMGLHGDAGWRFVRDLPK
jgi:hypothetical protein